MDVVDSKTRSRMMSGIRSSGTTPEQAVRGLMHRHGFRYRLNDASLPGKPDMVFRKYSAVVFVHGCFWHAHDCRLFKLPSSRADFWSKKLEQNVSRDLRVIRELVRQGFRVAVVWECATRKIDNHEALAKVLGHWLKSFDAKYIEIRDAGTNSGVSIRKSTARAI